MRAIYWARNITPDAEYLTWNGNPDSGNAIGLDLNYFSFDVNAISKEAIFPKETENKGSDACFVRTVESSAGN